MRTAKIKTPEELVQEYVNKLNDTHSVIAACVMAFLAGYKAAQDQLADADKVMPQWIRVEERLPQHNQQVFYRIRFLTKNGSKWLFDYGEWDADRQVFYGEFVDYKDLGGTVTHWMPLPPAPEEEK